MFNKDFTQSVFILIISTVIVASISFLVWVLPAFFYQDKLIAESSAKPLTALEVEGRDIYISEGCHTCHTMMVRPLDAEIKRAEKAMIFMSFLIYGVQNVLALILLILDENTRINGMPYT